MGASERRRQSRLVTKMQKNNLKQYSCIEVLMAMPGNFGYGWITETYQHEHWGQKYCAFTKNVYK